MPLAPRELYDPFSLTQMQVTWPHGHFRPSAVACDGDEVFVGDQFSIWRAEVSLEKPRLRPADVRSGSSGSVGGSLKTETRRRSTARLGGLEAISLVWVRPTVAHFDSVVLPLGGRGGSPTVRSQKGHW